MLCGKYLCTALGNMWLEHTIAAIIVHDELVEVWCMHIVVLLGQNDFLCDLLIAYGERHA